MQMERASQNNIAAQSVVIDPDYIRKYEDNVVQGRRASETDDEDEPEEQDEHAPDPSNRSLSEILQENKQHITSSDFWRDVNYILATIKPAVDLLKLADSDRLMGGKIYSHMLKIHEHFEEVEKKDPAWKGIAALWYTRWQRQHHPVHCMAHILHPDHSASNPLSDPYMNSEMLKVLKRHFPDTAERNSVHASILKYLSRQGHFSTYDAMGEERPVWSPQFMTELSPWQWWSNFLAVEPTLSKFAMRILQLCISSSACERAFSKWTFIINKYRTRLSLSRQVKSIYLYHNWRLLENSESDKWYRSDSEDEEDE